MSTLTRPKERVQPSDLEEVGAALEECLRATGPMTALTLLGELRARGFDGSLTEIALRALIRRGRVQKDPATGLLALPA